METNNNHEEERRWTGRRSGPVVDDVVVDPRIDGRESTWDISGKIRTRVAEPVGKAFEVQPPAHRLGQTDSVAGRMIKAWETRKAKADMNAIWTDLNMLVSGNEGTLRDILGRLQKEMPELDVCGFVLAMLQQEDNVEAYRFSLDYADKQLKGLGGGKMRYALESLYVESKNDFFKILFVLVNRENAMAEDMVKYHAKKGDSIAIGFLKTREGEAIGTPEDPVDQLVELLQNQEFRSPRHVDGAMVLLNSMFGQRVWPSILKETLLKQDPERPQIDNVTVFFGALCYRGYRDFLGFAIQLENTHKKLFRMIKAFVRKLHERYGPYNPSNPGSSV